MITAWRKTWRPSLCCLLVGLLAPGCAFGPDPTWSPADPRDYGSIAILDIEDPPTIIAPPPIKDYLGGMVIGATTGMVAMISLLDEPSPPTNSPPSKDDSPCQDEKSIGGQLLCPLVVGFVGAILAGLATLTASVVGALWGAGQTAAGYGPQPASLAETQQSITNATGKPHLQSQFAAAIHTALSNTSTFTPSLHGERDHVHSPTDIFTAQEQADTVLQPWIISIDFRNTSSNGAPRYGLSLSVQTNLYRRGQTTPVDIRQYQWDGPAYSLETWGSEGAYRVKTELTRGIEQLAEQIAGRFTSSDQAPRAQNVRSAEPVTSP